MNEIDIDLDKYNCCICGAISTPYTCMDCGANYCGNCHSNLKRRNSEYYDMVHAVWLPIVVTVCKKCGSNVVP